MEKTCDPQWELMDIDFVRQMYAVMKAGRLKTDEDIDNLFNLLSKMLEFGSMSNVRIKPEIVFKVLSEYDNVCTENVDKKYLDPDHWIAPLFLALDCYSTSLTVIKMLVRYGGVDVNAPLERGSELTAIEFACSRGDYNVVKLLLDLGADVTGDAGARCVNDYLIRRHGNADVLKLIVEKSANVNHTDANGESLLAKALRYGNSAIRDILHENGASVEFIRDEDLYNVCYTASVENLKFILDKKSVEISTRVKALEILGACLIANRRLNMNMALSVWTEAMHLRQSLEPPAPLTGYYHFASPTGFAQLNAPRKVEELLALIDRPVDAYLLALTIICNHRAPTCADVEQQLLFLPFYLDSMTQPEDIINQSFIDIYLRHLKILISSRAQTHSKPSGCMESVGLMHWSPYHNASLPYTVIIRFIDNSILFKVCSMMQAGIQIAPEIYNRWINGGLDILESMLVEPEMYAGHQGHLVCMEYHSLEEQIDPDNQQNRKESCNLMSTITAILIGFLAKLHIATFPTTHERLKSLTHRFLVSQQSSGHNRMMLLNRSIFLKASLATITHETGEKEILTSSSNPYFTMFLTSRRAANPLMADEDTGNTALHLLANMLSARRFVDVQPGMPELDEENQAMTAALKPVVRRYALMLLESGMHADARNSKGEVACKMLGEILPDGFDVFQYEKLQCLAVRVLRTVNYPLDAIPSHLSHLVSMH